MFRGSGRSGPFQSMVFDEALCCGACAASGLVNTAVFSLSRNRKKGDKEQPLPQPSAWLNLCEMHYQELADEQKQFYTAMERDQFPACWPENVLQRAFRRTGE